MRTVHPVRAKNVLDDLVAGRTRFCACAVAVDFVIFQGTFLLQYTLCEFQGILRVFSLVRVVKGSDKHLS